MRYITLNIPTDDRVPEGYQLIRAYSNGKMVVVELDVNDLKEDDHNCDWEGCSSISHVFSFSPEQKYNLERRASEAEEQVRILQQRHGKIKTSP